jgi:hypothetical protein
MNKLLKTIEDILSSKPKFRRFIIIFSIICITLLCIALFGFYTGAITWHGK